MSYTPSIPASVPDTTRIEATATAIAIAINTCMKTGKASYNGIPLSSQKYSDYKYNSSVKAVITGLVSTALKGNDLVDKKSEITSKVLAKIGWNKKESGYSPQLFDWSGSISAHVSTWVGMSMTAAHGKLDDTLRKSFYTYITSRTGDVATEITTSKIYAVYPEWKWPRSATSTSSRSSSNENVIVASEENIAEVTQPAVVERERNFAKISSMNALEWKSNESLKPPKVTVKGSAGPFSPDGDSTIWYRGSSSKSAEDLNKEYNDKLKKSGYISNSMFDGSAERQSPVYIQYTGSSGTKIFDSNEFKAFLIRKGYSNSEVEYMVNRAKKRGISKVTVGFGPVGVAEYLTSWHSEGRRIEMLNGDKTRIQNNFNFPFVLKEANPNLKNPVKAEYSYQIVPNDPRLPADSPIRNLEDRLMEARASLGIPVHGNNDIARSMKMYMYNRFKVPDTNMAFNKMTTHVFFTRPDLNLLDGYNTANQQVVGHTDTALLWRRYPELFKLLTDYSRCGDNDNLNLMLSNQISSFNLDDERLATIRGGKSWAEHEMVYGEQYTGRTAGEFTCTFDETNELSIINMMKLWITYIDNVSRGAWSPWYPHNDDNKVGYNYDEKCHVYERALDYAASVYVFKCAPDGEEILYWSKYYGVFPIVTGSSALAWDKSGSIGDSPKLSISFAYCFKKDLSPISLLEFNHAANADGPMLSVPSYEASVAGSHRPYVGSPYIEIDLGVPNMNAADANRSTKRTTVKLKYRKDESKSRTDEILFKNNIAKESVYSSRVPGATYSPNYSGDNTTTIRSGFAGSNKDIYQLNKAMADALIVKF